MPLERREDTKGCFFRWGRHGHKYYYNPQSTRSKNLAKEKAMKQARAIERSTHPS